MISPKISQVYRAGSATGRKFYGVFSDPGDRFEGDEIRARRILRTHAAAKLTTGDLIWGEGSVYLLYEHSRTSTEAVSYTHLTLPTIYSV